MGAGARFSRTGDAFAFATAPSGCVRPGGEKAYSGRMNIQGFTIFDTAIGPCGIAWGGKGILAVQLPEARAGATRTRLARRVPEARESPPPPPIARVIKDIGALLEGERTDLSGAVIDMEAVPAFNREVYAIARAIPPGETLSYGDVATRLGDATAARLVGQALGQNPFPIIVPCHRVLAADGGTGGFSARGGIATKLRILSIERARTSNAPLLFDDLPLAARPASRR
jgi:methylated-DNA-[protein]-cysteine S-methyltransferase